MRQLQTPFLPTPKSAEPWLAGLVKNVRAALLNCYFDTRYGASTHRVFSVAPGLTELEEGEIVFMDDGINRRLYTKLNDSLRFVTLT